MTPTPNSGVTVNVWQMLIGLAGSSLTGALATKLLDVFSKASRGRAYTMGAVDHAVATAMGIVTTRLEKVERQHEECRSELEMVRETARNDLDKVRLDARVLEARLDDSVRDRAELRKEIDRMMRGPIAGWGDKPPKDD